MLANCTSLLDAWNTTTRPDWLMWAATRGMVLSNTHAREFAFYSVKLVKHLLTPDAAKVLESVTPYVTDHDMQQAWVLANHEHGHVVHAQSSNSRVDASRALVYAVSEHNCKATYQNTLDAIWHEAEEKMVAGDKLFTRTEDVDAAEREMAHRHMAWLRRHIVPNFTMP